MKKQIIIAFALLFSVITVAQKKELKALEKAVKSKNFAEAKSLSTQLNSLVSAMDDKSKSKYYFNTAQAYYANGGGSMLDFDTALENFNKVDSKYVSELVTMKKSLENQFLVKANEQYTTGNFSNAAQGFALLYKLVPNDASYLYYAAVSATRAENMDDALSHYLKLKEIGYTGVETEYYATNNANSEVEVYDKNTRDKFVKLGTHSNPGTRTSESKEIDITKNIALIYKSQGKTKEALSAYKDARVLDPKNIDLLISEANMHYELGDTETYGVLIKEAITLDPNNSDLFFNLGVLAAKSNNTDKAKEYYKKASELNPKNANALTNMAALILSSDQGIIDQMNTLGNSAADNKRYDELEEQRYSLYREAIPYLEKVLIIEPNDISVLRTLQSIYSTLDDPKADELKAKIDTLNNE